MTSTESSGDTGATGDEFIVTHTQLNTYDEESKEFGKIPRGTTFRVGDEVGAPDSTPVTITEDMVRRWTRMRPAPIALKSEVEQRQQYSQDAQDRIAELEAEVAQYRAAAATGQPVAPATAAGDDAETTIDPGAGDAPGGAPRPVGNASRDVWAEYAKDQDPTDAAWIDDPQTTRDMIRDKYSKSA